MNPLNYLSRKAFQPCLRLFKRFVVDVGGCLSEYIYIYFLKKSAYINANCLSAASWSKKKQCSSLCSGFSLTKPSYIRYHCSYAHSKIHVFKLLRVETAEK